MNCTPPRGSHMSKDEWERTEKFRKRLSTHLGFILWADIGVEHCDEACRIAERDGFDAACSYARSKFAELFGGMK
jgi:hypothetical protein